MQKKVLYAVLAAGLIASLIPVGADQSEDPLKFEHMPGQLMVKFRPGTENSVIAAVNAVIGGQTKRTFRGDKDLRLVGLATDNPEALRDALTFYNLQPEVDYAEPDYVYRLALVPDDSSFTQLWGMNNTGQSGGLAGFDIDAAAAWDDHTDSPGVIIGSVDTGVDETHPDLDANGWVNAGEIAGNGIDDDNNGYVDDTIGWDFISNDNDPQDGHSHGTHTMGTAAAEGNNGIGVAGVTWSARIMVLKGCSDGGSCPSSATIPAIDYATDNGAMLTSNSWGGGGFSQSMLDAINRANNAGVLFSAAAGNAGSNNDISAFYPANYDVPNVISVASVDRFGNRSSFSNYGATTVDLGAPGSSIYSTTPNGGYGTKSGTSMACPHVSGALAFLMGANPNLNYLDYKQILMDSTEPNDALAGRTITGGTLNLRLALDLVPPLVVPPDNEAPVADAGGSYKGRAFRSITFDGSASFDPNAPGGGGVDLDDRVASYRWEFGDGSVVTSSSPTVTHAYPAGNNDYVVTLTVRDKFAVSSAAVTTTCRIRGGGKKPPRNP